MCAPNPPAYQTRNVHSGLSSALRTLDGLRTAPSSSLNIIDVQCSQADGTFLSLGIAHNFCSLALVAASLQATNTMSPESFDWTPAHSRTQPLTPPPILWGGRMDLYRSSS